MEIEKVKKVNPLYMLGYIFLPLLIYSTLMTLFVVVIKNSQIGTIGSIVLFGGLIFWYSFGGQKFYKSRVKKFEAELDAQGFKRNQTFYGKSQTVIVDVGGGKVASIFFWNPFKSYITPASRVEKAWVDDCKWGSGIMEGTQRVRFCFTLDGITMKVDTFISNQRYKMTDPKVLDAISKADVMVDVINQAKENAGAAVR